MNYLVNETISEFISSNNLLSPKSDGTNGLVYNITTDDIESIFKTYPEVKNKFVQNVPIKLTEKGKIINPS